MDTVDHTDSDAEGSFAADPNDGEQQPGAFRFMLMSDIHLEFDGVLEYMLPRVVSCAPYLALLGDIGAH
jgi:hypothetical protein